MTLAGLLHDLLATALILLAGLGLGRLCLAPLRLGEGGALGLWLAWAAGLGLLASMTLLVGAAGLLRLAVVAPLLAGLALVGAWALVVGMRRSIAAGALRLRAPGGPLTRGLAAALLLIGASSLVWVLLTHSLPPPTDWDAVAYHLALPKLYVAAGRLTYVPYIVTSNWPLGFEMHFALALLLRSEVAAHLTMLACTALIAAGLVAVGRRLFGDDRAGLIAAALFLTAPLVKRLGGVAMIDVAMGLYTLGAAVSLWRWQDERRRGWLILCGAFCGFAASTKLMGGGVAILFGLLFLWDLGGRWRRAGAPPRGWLADALALGLAGLAIVGPWYLRSYLNTGNPIWPFAYSVFGGRDWDQLGDEYHHQLLLETWAAVILPRNPIGLVQSLGLILMRPEDLGGYRGGLGWPLLAGAAAAAAMLPRAPRAVRESLFVAAGFWALWFFLVSHQVRYLLPVAPLLALAAGWACAQLLDLARPRAVRALLVAAVVAMALAGWPWRDAPERALLGSRVAYLRGAEGREQYLAARVDVLPLLEYANTSLPPGSRLLLVPYENRTYFLDIDYVWGHIISQRIIPFEQFARAEDLLEQLRALGVTHVLDDPSHEFTGPRYYAQDRALQLELQRRCGEPLFSSGDGVIYALVPCRPAAAGG